MLRSLDIVLIIVMTAAATLTYSIKHRAERMLEDVQKLESEIRLEKDTIDLLKADWALLSQPNRLERLMIVYDKELQLKATQSTQMVQPVELPKLRLELTPEEIEQGEKARLSAIAANSLPEEPEIKDVIKVAADNKKLAAQVKKSKKSKKSKAETDSIQTGSVKR